MDPEKIPWAALQVMLSQSTYGGRVDNEFDQKVLNSFVESIFVDLRKKSTEEKGPFDHGFKPSPCPSAPSFPEAMSAEGLFQWVAELPGMHKDLSRPLAQTHHPTSIHTHVPNFSFLTTGRLKPPDVAGPTRHSGGAVADAGSAPCRMLISLGSGGGHSADSAAASSCASTSSACLQG